VSLSVIAANTWAYDGSFNSFLIQPSVFYNFESVPGLVIGYNAGINADWKAASGDTWTVPLGVVVGKTFAVGGGSALTSPSACTGMSLARRVVPTRSSNTGSHCYYRPDATRIRSLVTRRKSR